MLKRTVFAIVCALALGVVLAACGSDDDGDEATAASGGGSDSGLTKAQAFVDKYSKTPTSIGLDTSVDGKPATGKTIVQLKCAVPECQEIYDGLSEAAGVVGWDTQDVNMGPTPEEVTQAFQQALDLNPDAIVISGIPLAVWKTYAEQAKQKGIPIVNISSTDKATGADGNGLVATLNGPPVTSGLGEMTGNFIVADSGADADVALFTVPDYPTLKPWVDATTKTIQDTCPSCKTQVVNAEATDIGTKLPQAIVSTIQQDPDINYVALAFGGMSTGVRSALNEAGFNDVKIVGEGSVAANLEALRAGTEQMWAAQVTKMQGWYATDVLLRFFNNQDLGAEQNDFVYPTQILTPDNVSDSGDQYLEPADYQDQFKQLWGVG
jgi:ribose transport system substrate-binding protein